MVEEPQGIEQPPDSHRFLDFLGRFKDYAPLGVIIGAFVLGFTIAREIYSGNLSRVQQELGHVKLELALKQHLPADKKEQGELPNNQVKVRVTSGNTASLGDELQISLIGTEFRPDPPRHTVIATVLAPGQEPMRITRAEVGYVVSYPGRDGFDIQILAADTLSAVFLVTRKKS